MIEFEKVGSRGHTEMKSCIESLRSRLRERPGEKLVSTLEASPYGHVSRAGAMIVLKLGLAKGTGEEGYGAIITVIEC